MRAVHTLPHAHARTRACLTCAPQALILPVIHRGLRDRTGDTKKKAARIAGNMASLVNDAKVRQPAGACSGDMVHRRKHQLHTATAQPAHGHDGQAARGGRHRL